MHYILSYKLIVNVKPIGNILCCPNHFAQKIKVRLNQEGGIHSNIRRYSQLLQDYFSDFHHAEMELKAPIKDLGFLTVLRPRLRKGCRSQNKYINDKHLLIQKPLSEQGDSGTSIYN